MVLTNPSWLVNFYSHLAIASAFTDDASIALGAMLPDFASILGVRLPRTTDPRIQKGCDLHHATDRSFHEHALFRGACTLEAASLRSLGIERGTSTAIAHVGLEFFLDEALADDEPSRDLYRRALAAATPAALSRCIVWWSPDQAASFELLRQRLSDQPLHRRPSPASALADRICRTLCRRPRLAVRADDRTHLESWAAEAPSRNATMWPLVTESVTFSLERAEWHVARDSVRSLRFRRARGDEV